MWVVIKASNGAATMTLAASDFTLKLLSMERINENPSNATADE